jgi:succinate dehydrogenase / fumarate reductase, cytochrome b subunit
MSHAPTGNRPLSPHLSVWKWHITMANSILQRATGVANFAGLVAIVAWLVALASGPEIYGSFEAIATSPFGLIVMVGFTFSVMFHLANGLRYLFWDNLVGFSPSNANLTAWLTYVFALIATAAIWAIVIF